MTGGANPGRATGLRSGDQRPDDDTCPAGSAVARIARCRRAREESRAATVGREAERPADENEQPVLEADQVPEVDDQPGRPGQEAAEPDAFDVGDCRCSADRGQVALVAVAEGGVLAP